MKLKNKKTGKIKECVVIPVDSNGYPNEYQVFEKGGSLAELNEEWENHEEPKEYWYIAELCAGLQKKQDTDNGEDRFNKQIGNYFETEEEAEKAVERLCAWKRLKDKGFEIEGWDNNIGDDYYKTGQIVLNLNNVRNREWDEYDQIMEIKNDLDLLFGGEE